jgi:hypothetical protein
MNIRNLDIKDTLVLRDIHEKYYDDFKFPDFLHGFINAFTIEEDGKIITGGGVRLIPESILITDKFQTRRSRREALLLALHASILSCQKQGFNQLHAFIQNDPNWIEILKKYNFKPINGTGLVLSF